MSRTPGVEFFASTVDDRGYADELGEVAEGAALEQAHDDAANRGRSPVTAGSPQLLRQGVSREHILLNGNSPNEMFGDDPLHDVHRH